MASLNDGSSESPSLRLPVQAAQEIRLVAMMGRSLQRFMSDVCLYQSSSILHAEYRPLHHHSITAAHAKPALMSSTRAVILVLDALLATSASQTA
jgi:hypothetical protein